MKRLSIILFFILVLLMVISIAILNTMKQNLTRTYRIKEEPKAGVEETITKEKLPLEKLEKPKEDIEEPKTLPRESKEPEFDLGQIPEQPVKDMEEKKEPQEVEVETPYQSSLRVRPSSEELKELRNRKVIIY